MNPQSVALLLLLAAGVAAALRFLRKEKGTCSGCGGQGSCCSGCPSACAQREHKEIPPQDEP